MNDRLVEHFIRSDVYFAAVIRSFKLSSFLICSISLVANVLIRVRRISCALFLLRPGQEILVAFMPFDLIDALIHDPLVSTRRTMQPVGCATHGCVSGGANLHHFSLVMVLNVIRIINRNCAI